MILLSDNSLLAIVTLVQLFGLLSLALLRVTERHFHQALYQQMFFVGLCLVGLATMCCLQCNDSSWITSAITLATMVLGATLDLRPIARNHGQHRVSS